MQRSAEANFLAVSSILFSLHLFGSSLIQAARKTCANESSNTSSNLTKKHIFRCAFHAYADSTYAKHLESGQSIYGTIGGPTPIPMSTPTGPNGMGPAVNGAREYQQSVLEVSEDSINSIEKVEEWKMLANGNSSPSSAGVKRMSNGATPSPRDNGKRTKRAITV